MLSIALGHAADALCHCLAEIRELSANMNVRRTTFTMAERGESKPMTADDQVVCVSGLLEGGTALSIHYRGERSRGHEPAPHDSMAKRFESISNEVGEAANRDFCEHQHHPCVECIRANLEISLCFGTPRPAAVPTQLRA
jgi:hypothetical protein